MFTLVQGPEPGWTAPVIIGSAVAGVLLLAAFVLIESRSADPLMRLRLLASRNLRAGMAVTFLFMATFGTLLYFQTVYFQNVHGYGAVRTGLAFLVPMGAILIGSQLGGRMTTRFGVRAMLLVSRGVGAIGCLMVGLSLSAQGSYAELVPGLVVLGQGATFITMFAAAGMGVAAHEQGHHVRHGVHRPAGRLGGRVGCAHRRRQRARRRHRGVAGRDGGRGGRNRAHHAGGTHFPPRGGPGREVPDSGLIHVCGQVTHR